MKHEINLTIAGLGVIFYSPFAVEHIAEGEDYLSSNFWEPDMVAKHVMDCRLSAFCTGSPGEYVLRLIDGDFPHDDMKNAMTAVRLGIEVRNETLCFRDLYDLLEWKRVCPANQTIAIPSGFYLLTVFTQLPQSGIIGDNQQITIHFQSVSNKPALNWKGVPDLSGA